MSTPATHYQTKVVSSLFWYTALIFVPLSQAQAENATSATCVQKQVNPKSGLLEIVNHCQLPVSVYYRDLKKSIQPTAEKTDAKDKPRNAFYTHMKPILAGKTEAIYLAPAERIRVALCLGQKHHYSSNGFRSDESGNYVCPDSDVPEDYLLVQATGSTRDEACAAVRNAFLPDMGATLDCQCIVQASSGKAYCRTAGPASNARDEKDREGANVSVVGWVKNFLREKNKQYWEEKYRNCGEKCPDPARITPRNGGPGVRG